MTDLDPTPAPAPVDPSRLGNADSAELSWVSALIITVTGAITTGIAWGILAVIGVLISLGAGGLDEIQALSSESMNSEETQDAVLDLAGQVIGALAAVTLLVWLIAAGLYKGFLALFFDWKLGYGWALLAVGAGWAAGLLGGVVDLALGFLTLGFASTACNALAAAAIIRKVACKPL